MDENCPYSGTRCPLYVGLVSMHHIRTPADLKEHCRKPTGCEYLAVASFLVNTRNTREKMDATLARGMRTLDRNLEAATQHRDATDRFRRERGLGPLVDGFDDTIV